MVDIGADRGAHGIARGRKLLAERSPGWTAFEIGLVTVLVFFWL